MLDRFKPSHDQYVVHYECKQVMPKNHCDIMENNDTCSPRIGIRGSVGG